MEELLVDIYGQSPYACRFQWGPEGVRRAAANGHIVIIVDVLVFSTSTVAAAAQGAAVMPVGSIEQARAAVAQWSGVELLGRARPTPEGWSHSPVSLTNLPAGLRLVYYSANGSRCCSAAVQRPPGDAGRGRVGLRQRPGTAGPGLRGGCDLLLPAGCHPSRAHAGPRRLAALNALKKAPLRPAWS